MDKSKTVHIFNMSEDVWPFISSIDEPKQYQYEINDNSDLCDRGELFSDNNNGNLIYISPKKIDDNYISYVKKLFSLKSIEVIVPPHHSGIICQDIIDHRHTFNRLLSIGRKTGKLIITSYSASDHFFKLIKNLQMHGIKVSTPEAPDPKDSWTVNFFGTKSGIRQLVQTNQKKHPYIKIPNGYICNDINQACCLASYKFIKEKGVVLKTNKGHSGAGVLIFRQGDIFDQYQRCRQSIDKILQKNSYWTKFPIIVESYVDSNPSVAGGFPNVEFKINKNGQIEFLYFCGLRVTPDGVFNGIEINQNIVPKLVYKKIVNVGLFIAKQYRKYGYRGYFDIDFISSKNNRIYISESNTRRTGGTYVYQAARLLIGPDFIKKVYILSDNALLISKKIKTFNQLQNLLLPLLFNKSTKKGIVIASSNLINQHRLAYIIFAKNKTQANLIEAKMKKLLIDVN